MLISPKLIYRFSSIHNFKEVFTVGTSQADSKFYREAQGSRTDHRGSYTEGQNRKTDCGIVKGSYSKGGVPYSCAHLDKSQTLSERASHQIKMQINIYIKFKTCKTNTNVMKLQSRARERLSLACPLPGRAREGLQREWYPFLNWVGACFSL